VQKRSTVDNVVCQKQCSHIRIGDKRSARAHIVWETMVLRRPKRSVECSDSEKNMSAFADQNHAPSLTCVRLELYK